MYRHLVTASGKGNPVFIGSSTGKDAYGAAFASKDLTEDSVDDIPQRVGRSISRKL